jgi:hypothetical protein
MKPPGPKLMPSGRKRSASDALIATAKVWTKPMSSEATNAPAREPSPPTTTTTKRIGPSSPAMLAWVTRAGPAMTPAMAASAVPTPKTSMNTRGTLWPSAATMSGWVSAAWMMRPTRVRVRTARSTPKIRIATASMNIL